MPDVPLTAPGNAVGKPVLVGYSGGLDSTVLLHLLAMDAGVRGNGLRAIHVHHGLHPDADAWAAHCERNCTGLGIALDVVRVDVRRDGGEGLEAAARNARHAAFGAALGDGGILALAHHRDDQAETFLLRALRASGVDGLAAMRPWRAFGHGWLWRPLLHTPRPALEAYASRHALDWIDDPSNVDDRHERNFLRWRVMPLLRERWPHAGASFARSAALQHDAATLLDDGDAAALAAVRCVDPGCIDATRLMLLPAPRRARVLRRWIADTGLPVLPAEGIARIERDLLAADAADAPEFAWHDAVVRRWGDLLWAERLRPSLPRGYRVQWRGNEALALPTGGRLRFADGDAAACDGGVTAPYIVHARDGGERIVLPGRTHSHALKHVLQDLGVPPWLRMRMPLLSTADGTLLAAGDLVFSAAFDARPGARHRRLVWSDATP